VFTISQRQYFGFHNEKFKVPFPLLIIIFLRFGGKYIFCEQKSCVINFTKTLISQSRFTITTPHQLLFTWSTITGIERVVTFYVKRILTITDHAITLANPKKNVTVLLGYILIDYIQTKPHEYII